MKESQNKNKISVITKALISLGVVLVTAFYMFFLIGTFSSTPVEGETKESVKQVNTQQQEMKNETSSSKQKRPDGKPVGKVVYLTFDDGPSELTGQFIDVLK
ncbi:polysaccharide deacetylase family protein, partial [Peribacillus simplex]|uniref:polysaccharide deacetylase family protein n=1 Tax=Peribacillus simplex TaxID=1478 RepID=UPI003D2A9105